MFYYLRYTNQIKYHGEWCDLGIFYNEGRTDCGEPHIEEFSVKSFEELQKFAENFYGMCNDRTLFGTPIVKATVGLGSYIKFSAKKMERAGKTIQFRRVWEEFTPTMNWLLENVDADDFVQYAKDRNWNNISIGK